MPLARSTGEWIAWGAFAWAAYEIVRWLVVRTVRSAVRARVAEFLMRGSVRLDRFKLASRVYVHAELLSDPIVLRAMVEHAREHHVPLPRVRRAVQMYVDEIVPAFSPVSYYQFGLRIARFVANSLYHVVVDRAALVHASHQVARDVPVIYVMNHRSNADYVIASLALLRSVALSWAVGEWARVWPLDVLFRSFGGYFVRRRFKEALYHTVLRRYVQLLARQGVAQGIFLEGGLSRDGALLPAKTGLLDYVVEEAIADPSHPMVFVPIGINYDWVLEDRVLLDELRRGGKKPGLLVRFASLLQVLLFGGPVLVANAVLVLLRRRKQHGQAQVVFGEPRSLEDLMAAEGLTRDKLGSLGPRKRVEWLATRLMREIGAVVPAVPVAIVARALVDAKAERIEKDDLVLSVGRLLARLRERGAPIGGPRSVRDRPASHAEPIRDVEQTVIAEAQAEQLTRMGLRVLVRRGLVRERGSAVQVRPSAPEVLRYYARSIQQHLEDPAPRLH